jgi:CheY-like chemotaxis protein
VTAIADGDHALRVLLEEEFDVVLCDISMPNLTGDRLYTTLQRLRPLAAARMVFVSGWSADAVEELLEAEGSVAPPFLAKPFTSTQLANVVRQRYEASTALDRARSR